MITSKRPTLNDLAQTAGCSRALASIVMRDAPGASDKTRAKVKKAAKRIGYRPDQHARRLRSGSSKLIGVVYRVRHPFHAEIIAELYGALAPTPFDLVLGGVTEERDEAEAINPLLETRCEALILIGTEMSKKKLHNLAREITTVVVARNTEGQPVDSVCVDDARGEKMAVNYLIERGHKNILHVSGGTSPGAAKRVEGYRQAMRAAGLERFIRHIDGGTTETAGLNATTEIINGGELPTAICAFNDRCAVGIQNSLLRRGLKVPEDVSIVGFDDSPTAQTAVVPLTTISQDANLMAKLALERAINQITNSIEPAAQIIIPQLIVRDSVADLCPT